MYSYIRYLLLISFLFFFMACNGQQPKKEKEFVLNQSFKPVDVPAIISDPQERIDYAVKHYWEHFNFVDTTYIHLPEVTEQAFSDYLAVLTYASPEAATFSIKKVLKQAEVKQKMYTYFTELFEKYLYDPNSPRRNEELFILVLEAMLESSSLDEVTKIRPAHLLELALRNRVGEASTDFIYTLPNGDTGRLYQLKSDFLLLYFYNPDCDACRELTKQIKHSPEIKKLNQINSIKVLAVYPDEDLTAWKENLGDMPKEWILSYDSSANIKNEEIYDLKAIPCVYLLDKDKKVILKDVSFEDLSGYLSLIIK